MAEFIKLFTDKLSREVRTAKLEAIRLEIE